MSGIVPDSLVLYPHFSNVDIVPIALGEGGGEWTMANQLYVKSGESPHVFFSFCNIYFSV